MPLARAQPSMVRLRAHMRRYVQISFPLSTACFYYFCRHPRRGGQRRGAGHVQVSRLRSREGGGGVAGGADGQAQKVASAEAHRVAMTLLASSSHSHVATAFPPLAAAAALARRRKRRGRSGATTASLLVACRLGGASSWRRRRPPPPGRALNPAPRRLVNPASVGAAAHSDCWLRGAAVRRSPYHRRASSSAGFLLRSPRSALGRRGRRARRRPCRSSQASVQAWTQQMTRRPDPMLSQRCLLAPECRSTMTLSRAG